MKKYLPSGVELDIVKNAVGDFNVNIRPPRVLPGGSVDEKLKNVYDTVYGTLVALQEEAYSIGMQEQENTAMRNIIPSREELDRLSNTMHKDISFPDFSKGFLGGKKNMPAGASSSKHKKKKTTNDIQVSLVPGSGYAWNPHAGNDAQAFTSTTTYETFTPVSTGKAIKPKAILTKKKANAIITNQNNGQAGISKKYTFEDAKNGLKVVYQRYGKQMAEIVEKMYRDETANFTSKQYVESGTPGMQAVPGAKAPYYGWGKKYFDPNAMPVGTTSMWDNKGNSANGGNAQNTKTKTGFVIMPSVESAMLYLAKFIQAQNGNYARWHSTIPDHQDAYRKVIETYYATLVDEIEKEETSQH